jgi:hypothetical protein
LPAQQSLVADALGGAHRAGAAAAAASGKPG